MAAAAASSSAPSAALRDARATYIDIGANLLDGVFRGKYHGKRAHASDLDALLVRAGEAGVSDVIVTCSNLKDARRALAWAREHNAARSSSGGSGGSGGSGAPPPVRLHTTVGVHPTNTLQLEPGGKRPPPAACSSCGHVVTLDDGVAAAPTAAGGGGGDAAGGGGGDAGGGAGGPDGSESDGSVEGGACRSRRAPAALGYDAYVAALHEVAADGVADGTVVAVGECGLDYDRLFFAPREVQLRHFDLHFALAERHGLPLFLHDRATEGDFARILAANRSRFRDGVVHSFTGSKEEAAAYLDLGLYIGVNGCSLKTEGNLAVVAGLPLDRLMLETDAPWCDIRRTHASSRYVRTVFPTVKKEKWKPGSLVSGRNEPCTVVQVAEVVAAVKGCTVEEVAAASTANARRVFFKS